MVYIRLIVAVISQVSPLRLSKTSVIVNNNSSFQNYTNLDDHTQQTTDTPGFKPFTIINSFKMDTLIRQTPLLDIYFFTVGVIS